MLYTLVDRADREWPNTATQTTCGRLNRGGRRNTLNVLRTIPKGVPAHSLCGVYCASDRSTLHMKILSTKGETGDTFLQWGYLE